MDFKRRYDSDQLREQLYLEQEGICAICNEPMQDSCGVICAIDHATAVNVIANWDWSIEKACEVANAKRNLQAVHGACNTAKREADHEEFCAAIERGEIVIGEAPELTTERIEALKVALTKRARKGGLNQPREAKVKGGRIGGPKGGRKSFELYGRPATLESCAKGGREGILRVNEILGPEGMSARGRKGGRKHFELHGNPATPEGCAKGGRSAVESGQLARLSELPQSIVARRRNALSLNHNRFHVRHNIVNPKCALCQPVVDQVDSKDLKSLAVFARLPIQPLAA